MNKKSSAPKNSDSKLVIIKMSDAPSNLGMPPNVRWGKWSFNKKNLTLEHDNRYYYVDLEKINSSSAMLDIIFQIQGKKWVDSDNTTLDLLRALNEILCPQGNYCRSKFVDGSKLSREYARRVAAKPQPQEVAT